MKTLLSVMLVTFAAFGGDGRFQLFSGHVPTRNGAEPATFKIDTATGETWLYVSFPLQITTNDKPVTVSGWEEVTHVKSNLWVGYWLWQQTNKNASLPPPKPTGLLNQ